MSPLGQTIAVAVGFVLAMFALAAWSEWVVRRQRRLTRCPSCACLIDGRRHKLCPDCLAVVRAGMCTSCRHRPAERDAELCAVCESRVEQGRRQWDDLIARGEH